MNDIKKYPLDFIFPLKQKLFENIKINIPNQFKEYSKINFGDFPPPFPKKSKRRPHEGGGHVDPFYTCKKHYKMYPKLSK